MATVTHVIRSDYDPKDRERLEILTGQVPTESEIDEEWEKTAATIAKPRTRPPPSFVPASSTYDPWTAVNSSSTSNEPKDEHQDDSKGGGIPNWYRSLSNRRSQSSPLSSTSALAGPRAGQTPLRVQKPVAATKSSNKPRVTRDWFIQNALSSSEEATASTSSITLDDMLARHPPPLPSEPKFKPPVFLAIGPSNKGFSMLQQQGWNEGEPLGPHIRRDRKPVTHIIPDHGDMIPPAKRQRQAPIIVKPEPHDSALGVTEVIDLTISDEEDEDAAEKAMEILVDPEGDEEDDKEDDDGSGRTALITPIATVLKADRLGIGLKAKTVGPHRASKKRITHSVAALAAHQRAAERLRSQKQEHGRGRRGFARAKQKEHGQRQQLLAYMNA
ncbi:hypothetical protein ONZ45_g18684 [Pleurotus djamor]|nr:hypothetical protein ONZ45_g18684 [Pleurotus djamor]